MLVIIYSVWPHNPETGETELKEVLNVWVKETDEILHVSTSDGETIDTTTNHPFYVDGKGWVAAGDLEVGDTLVTADGNEVEVTDLELDKFTEPIFVYNLEVEDFHTYFVGEYGVLVHNYEVAGKGHTGRQEPKNLLEQMHMENLLENPLANAYELPIELNDTRWRTIDGWTKWESIVKTSNGDKSVIHFVYNKLLDLFDDFKFKF